MWLYIYAMTSKINGDCLLVNSENKEKIKAPHYSPFVKGIHQMNGTFFSQRAINELTFPFHHSPKGRNSRKKSMTFYLNTRRAALYGYLWTPIVLTQQGRVMHIYSISQEICTRFCCALLCCGYAIVHNEFTWRIYPYSSGLLCWHWGNR